MPNQKRSGTHPASCTFSVAYCRLSPSELQSCSYPLVMCAAVVAQLLALAGCAQEQPVETSAAVEVVSGEKKTIQHTVVAEAVLFPLQQATVAPKISAPVKAFYIQRGSAIRQGQLRAVVENHDLAAAAQENQGTDTQAQAAYETTTASDLPREVQQAQLDLQAAKELFTAPQKIYDSRQELYQQGAMPRKELDQAGVYLAWYGFFPPASLHYFYGIDAHQFAVQPPDGTQSWVCGDGVSAIAGVELGSELQQCEAGQPAERLSADGIDFTQPRLLANLQAFYDQAQTARPQLDSWHQSAEKAVEMGLTTLRCQSGQATVLEVVDAQNTLTATRNAFNDGRERNRVGIANLQ